MREGSTIHNPINAVLYKSLYPKFKLPNNTYIEYKNKLYLRKNNTMNLIKTFLNIKRPEEEPLQTKHLNKEHLKKN